MWLNHLACWLGVLPILFGMVGMLQPAPPPPTPERSTAVTIRVHALDGTPQAAVSFTVTDATGAQIVATDVQGQVQIAAVGPTLHITQATAADGTGLQMTANTPAGDLRLALTGADLDLPLVRDGPRLFQIPVYMDNPAFATPLPDLAVPTDVPSAPPLAREAPTPEPLATTSVVVVEPSTTTAATPAPAGGGWGIVLLLGLAGIVGVVVLLRVVWFRVQQRPGRER